MMRERFLEEIEDDQLRLEKKQGIIRMFRLADSSGCRHQGILEYFGEAIAPCENSCDMCTDVTTTDLVREMALEARKSGKRTKANAAVANADRSPSDPMFQRLRELRKRLADKQGVPAYIVFGDQVLWNLIDRRPTNPEEMLEVSGVGPAKLERYGDAFLAALGDG